jgi:prepilin-type N-terminal cleavage/methylation domain-containing protein
MRTPALVRSNGFSLIELLITIVIAAILVGLAVPEFNALIRRNSVEASTNVLRSSFSFARSEAIKRAANVSVIPIGAWTGGWQIILDNGTRDPDCEMKVAQDERVLRQVDSQRTSTNIFENAADGTCGASPSATSCVTFDREGRNITRTGNPIRSGFCIRDRQNLGVLRVVEFSQTGQSFLERSQQ